MPQNKNQFKKLKLKNNSNQVLEKNTLAFNSSTEFIYPWMMKVEFLKTILPSSGFFPF
jgi:hypothetical protein